MLRRLAYLAILMTVGAALWAADTAGEERRLTWKVLGGVEWEGNEGDALDFKLAFSDEILGYKDKSVVLTGYMLPLEEAEMQQHFLLMRTPSAGCAFCIDVGPESVVEVKLQKPLEYSAGRVTVLGKLELLEDDPTGLYFRIQNATARHGR